MVQSKLRSYFPGETICRQGEPANAIYILRKGRVAVEVLTSFRRNTPITADLRGHVVAEIASPGAMVGEAGLFLDHRTATVRAIGEGAKVEVISIDRGGFRKLLEARPDTGLKLCRSLALRLRNLSQQMRAASEATYTVHLLYDSLALSLHAIVSALRKTEQRDPGLQAVMDAAMCLPTYRDAGRLRNRLKGSQAIFARALAGSEFKTIELEPGVLLFSKGEPGKVAYIIEYGTVDLFIGDLHVASLGSGEVVGAIALLLGDELAEATRVQVDKGARVIPISAAEFEQTARNIPEFLYGLAHSLCRRMESSNRMACDIARGIEYELDLLAGSPESCEAAFVGLAIALERYPALYELAQRARTQAERAVRGRQRMAATFEHLLR